MTTSPAPFASPAQAVSLPDLTVPAGTLPAGCAISPAPAVRIGAGAIRAGLWAGLPIDRNPWIGTDRAITAAVRERIDSPSRVPDGPPLAAAGLARYRLGLADGIEQSYAAVYMAADGALVTEYALEFPTPQDADRFRGGLRRSTGADAFTLSAIVVVVAGAQNACREAVAAYVGTLR